MDRMEWRRIADKEARAYRRSVAFVKGYLEGGGSLSSHTVSERFRERLRWVWAIERVREHLKRSDATKSAFFTAYYGLDRPMTRREQRATLVQLSLSLYASPATLSRWRDEILDDLLLAATQVGAIRVFSISEKNDTRTPF